MLLCHTVSEIRHLLSFGIILVCQIPRSNYKRMKKNLGFRKKNIFKKHLLMNVQQNTLARTMEWLRNATNALEEEDYGIF